ncbi:hypothetical protein BQ8420_26270 [Nocardiopsis sp. JB363]|nr:hypothetical protein BQ8420_26270 [Nocardiopsis sp. JB363]
MVRTDVIRVPLRAGATAKSSVARDVVGKVCHPLVGRPSA